MSLFTANVISSSRRPAVTMAILSSSELCCHLQKLFLAMVLFWGASRGGPVKDPLIPDLSLAGHENDILVDRSDEMDILQNRILKDAADLVESEMVLRDLKDQQEQLEHLVNMESKNFIQVYDPNNTFHSFKGTTKGELVWRSDIEAEHPEILAAMPDEQEMRSKLSDGLKRGIPKARSQPQHSEYFDFRDTLARNYIS